VWQASARWESYLNILDKKRIRYVVWGRAFLANADENFPELCLKVLAFSSWNTISNAATSTSRLRMTLAYVSWCERADPLQGKKRALGCDRFRQQEIEEKMK
jgi:hypothetical protein